MLLGLWCIWNLGLLLAREHLQSWPHRHPHHCTQELTLSSAMGCFPWDASLRAVVGWVEDLFRAALLISRGVSLQEKCSTDAPAPGAATGTSLAFSCLVSSCLLLADTSFPGPTFANSLR